MEEDFATIEGLKNEQRYRDAFTAAIDAARIEQLMLEAFTQLLRKRNLVTGLKIDPETFRIELTGGDSRPLAALREGAQEQIL